jgi:transcriptional regulator with XRE-family HTH domain
MNIGQRLRVIRTERNLSDVEIAALSGVHFEHIRLVENGTIFPDIHTLESIARACRCKLYDFFDAPLPVQLPHLTGRVSADDLAFARARRRSARRQMDDFDLQGLTLLITAATNCERLLSAQDVSHWERQRVTAALKDAMTQVKGILGGMGCRAPRILIIRLSRIRPEVSEIV